MPIPVWENYGSGCIALLPDEKDTEQPDHKQVYRIKGIVKVFVAVYLSAFAVIRTDQVYVYPADGQPQQTGSEAGTAQLVHSKEDYPCPGCCLLLSCE